VFKLFLLFFALLSICSGREWTSKDGKKIEASYLDYKQGFVFLERVDGKKFKVPLKMFSDQDVAFVRAEIVKRRKALGFDDHELFPIQVGDKFGYIDVNGLVIIEPKYDDCEYFSEGLAYVKLDGKVGFINSKEELKISFRKFERYSSDFNFPKEDSRKFLNGLVVFKGKDGKYGFLDKNGEWAIEPKYLAVAPFYEGFAVVEIAAPGVKGRSGFPNYEIIDIKGEKLVDMQFRGIGMFSDGVIPVQLREKDSTYGVLNSKGEWVVQPKYDHIFDFESGLACVWGGEKGSYIDVEGNEVFGKTFDKNNIHTGYITGSVFRCGLLIDGFKGNFNFYSRKTLDKEIGPLDFFSINHFSENLASFLKVEKGKYGFLNLQGEIVIKPRFTKVKDFKNGLALVEDGVNRMYINKKGKVVWHTKIKK